MGKKRQDFLEPPPSHVKDGDKRMNWRCFFSKFLSTLLILSLSFTPTLAQTKSGEEERFSIIVDAEAEETLRIFLDPMLKIAGLQPEKIRVIIINTNVMNASAVSGGVMAINTGLLLRVKNVEELLGVLAHEVGHFMGGHHIRIAAAMERSTASIIAGALLGGIAMAVGSFDGALASMLAGQHVAMQTYLAHRRGEESAADQSAVTILDQLHITSRGMVTFFETLAASDLLHKVYAQNAYAQTHPLNSERINFVKNHTEKSPYGNQAAPQEWQEAWNRLHAKLLAFLVEPAQAQKVFASVPHSPAGQYGQAIVDYRLFKLPQALERTRKLIEQEPNNPYFNELMGQIYFETGKIKQSLPYYRKATSLKPSSPTLAINAAHALIESNEKQDLNEAVHLLESVVEKNQDYPMAWHFLAMAYGKQNDMGKVAWSLAEKAVLMGDVPMATSQANRALKLLPQGAPQRMRLQDILNTQMKQDKKGPPHDNQQNVSPCPSCGHAHLILSPER